MFDRVLDPESAWPAPILDPTSRLPFKILKQSKGRVEEDRRRLTRPEQHCTGAPGANGTQLAGDGTNFRNEDEGFRAAALAQSSPFFTTGTAGSSTCSPCGHTSLFPFHDSYTHTSSIIM